MRDTGFEVLEPFVAHAPGMLDDAARAGLLQRCASHLRRLGSLPRLFFEPGGDDGPDERPLLHVTRRCGFPYRYERIRLWQVSARTRPGATARTPGR